MTAFLIRPEDEKHLKAAAERAEANPIPWEVLKTGVLPGQEDADRLTLADRAGAPDVSRTREEVMLPLGWRVSITCEEQPAGHLLHLSMSSPVKGKIPTEHAMRLVIEACGFTLEDCARGWLEEFEPGWNALNVLIFLKPHKLAS
jgi:hypothetical protein